MIFQELKVVIWKNLIIRKRHWFLTLIEALLPVCLFFLIAYARSKIKGLMKIEVTEAQYNDPYEFSTSINIGNTYLLYTPNSDFYNNIITRAHTKMQMPSDQVKRFGSQDELLEYYYKNTNHTTIAVIFDGTDPKKLNYAIRFYEPYYSSKFLSTDKMYDISLSLGYHHDTYEDSAFIAMQYIMDTSFIEYNMNKDLTNGYSIKRQQFPYPPHKQDSAITTIFLEYLPLITLFSFIFICPAVLKRVVEEKHSGIKELMKMVGMKSWMLWLGWFIYGIIPMLLSVSCIVILMKVPIFGSEYPLIENSNWTVLYAFLILYCTACISFCFAISSFFTQPTIALVIGILIWIISFFVPKYSLGLDEANFFPWSKSMLINLLPNMALHFGYSVIATFEEREVGIHWNNIYMSANGAEDSITMLNVYVMLIIDTIIYTLFTFYMDGINPGKYGIRRSFIFPIKQLIKSFCKPKEDKMKVTPELIHLDKVEEGTGLKKSIEIINLYKRFGENLAVDNLNLDIYNNQITVLLGHNGAGKSTTMSIITGMLEASCGTIRIDGLDVQNNINEIRKNLGLCPQHNLLFTDLTVKEHLIFFAKLKGKTAGEADAESEELLEKLNLSEKRNAMPHSLSGGMQRKLCLGMALIGGSKILILDEPSSGMDPESRRKLWDLLLTWRNEKTILITTHFMEEADALGDWIAIMDSGTLNCYGTPMYLKKQYNTGYYLSLTIKKNCDPTKEISNLISKEISDAYLNSKNGNNVMFVLPFGKNTHFLSLLEILEAKKDALGIENISVTMTTLEDVFLKTRTDKSTKPEPINDTDQNVQDDIDQNVQGVNEQENWALMLRTLVKKKMQYISRKPLVYIICIVIALFFFLWTGYLSGNSNHFKPNGPKLNLRLSAYRQTSVYISGTIGDQLISNLITNYRKEVESQGSLLFNVSNVEEAIIKKGKTNIAYFKEHMVAGASVKTDNTTYTLTALYNDIPMHSLPIALNLVTNTLAKTLLGPEYSISISNWPLPSIKDTLAPNQYSVVNICVLWLILLPIGCLFIQSNFIIYPYTEISTMFLKLQYMCGVKAPWYWGVNFIVDMILYLIVMIPMTGILFVLSPMLKHSYEYGLLLYTFILYGCSGIPFAYIFSRKKSISGASAMFLITGLFLGIIMTVIIEVLIQSQDVYWTNIGNYIKYVCLIFIPQVGLTDGLVNFAQRAVTIHNYEVAPKHFTAKCFSHNQPCCIENSPECYDFKHYDNIFHNHYLMLVGCIIYLWLNIVLESYELKKIWAFIKKIVGKDRKICRIDEPNQSKDVDKSSKDLEIDTPNRSQDGNKSSTYLKATKLSKCYSGQKIVNEIDLMLKDAQCLVVLGVNGAGKSTTFKMLTKEEVIDSGSIEVHLNEKVYNINTEEYLKNLGYCPQIDSLNFVLTGRQILTAIFHLRNGKDTIIVDYFLKVFELEKIADKPCEYYSGGNKRKLSMAVSLIGSPQFILLDEPTNGVDPSSRRRCWGIIKLMQKKKHSFFLSSHSMTECEALCNEVKIMKKGKFVKEGTLAELKNNFEGFSVKIKLRSQTPSIVDVDEVDGNSCGQSAKFKSIEDLKQHFTLNGRGEIKDEHCGLLHFHIKEKNKEWSKIFREVEDIKDSNPDLIEDYAISEVSLEDVLLGVAH